MSETSTHTDTANTNSFRGNLGQTHSLLKIVYGAVPIIAGLDKFTNVLVTWTDYLPAAAADLLPVEPMVFMYVVGVIEIVAGVIVLSRYTESGSYLVAVWLVAIAAIQVIAGNFDIAVRDLVMAVGAVALAQLSAADVAT